MDCYEYRMWRLGFSHKRAKRICREYLYNSGPAKLDAYITELESYLYVD